MILKSFKVYNKIIIRQVWTCLDHPGRSVEGMGRGHF